MEQHDNYLDSYLTYTYTYQKPQDNVEMNSNPKYMDDLMKLLNEINKNSKIDYSKKNKLHNHALTDQFL